MNWPKAALILGLFAIVTASWLARWSDPVPVGSAIYILDRATGDVFLIGGDQTIKVKPPED